jgi:hypothetical protein
MKKNDVIIKLKQVQENCDVTIERTDYGALKRGTCILHKYFESIGKKRGTMPSCLGGQKPCSEIQGILGIDMSITHCPTIHQEVYDLVKNYKFPRNTKI